MHSTERPLVMVHSHTRWDGRDVMGCAALVTQCISMKALETQCVNVIEIRCVTSAAHPIPSQRVCECTINQSINQSVKFISKCKNSAHSKHVMHLGGTAR